MCSKEQGDFISWEDWSSDHYQLTYVEKTRGFISWEDWSPDNYQLTSVLQSEGFY